MIELRSYSDWHHEVVDVRADGDWPIAVCESFDDALQCAADAGMHPLAVAAHRIGRHTTMGVYAPESLRKLMGEYAEMVEAFRHSSTSHALTNLASVAYDAGQCIVNGLLCAECAERIVRDAVVRIAPDLAGKELDVAIALAEAKYAARRAIGWRDHAREREACLSVWRDMYWSS